VRASVALVAAASVGPLLALRSQFPTMEWVAWAGAAVLVAIAGAFQIAKVVLDHRRDVESANFRVQLRDALLPVTAVVAELDVDAPYEVRREQLKTAAQATTGALYQLVAPHSPRVRANVFWIDEAGELAWLAHSGRGERPGAFVRGTARGDAAFEFLFCLRPDFYADLRRRTPDGYEGTQEGYRTFIAIPIWTTGKVFGMITIDSPKARSLVLEDQYVAEIFAELMGLAFEKGLHGAV
jgi:GAF domain-containing protein